MSSTRLARQVAAHFAHPEQTLHTQTIGLFVRRLVEGKPIERSEAASLLNCGEGDLDERLDRLPARMERDDQGRIIGAWVTQRPTPHEFVIDDKRLYTWCALDALIFPVLLGRSARVRSPCAATGQTVSITVSPHGIRWAEPAEAVVSVVAPATDIRDLRQGFCVHVNFFVSREAAHGWIAEHPGAEVLDLPQAFELAQQLVRWFDASQTCSAAGGCATA